MQHVQQMRPVQVQLARLLIDVMAPACSSIDKNQGLDIKSVTAHHTTKSGEGFKVVSMLTHPLLT